MKKRQVVALTLGMAMMATCIPAIAAEDEVVTLTYFNSDGKEEDPWTNPVATALTEATGVKIELQYPVTSDAESIALMIADDEYPDMIFAKGNAGSLYDAGAFIDMEPLIDEYAPNIKEFYGEEYNKLRWSAEDTGIYQLSYYEIGNSALETSGTCQIQYAALKENDWVYPTTLEEYEALIKKYLEAHPTTEDGQEMIGISLSAADWHWYITLSNPAGFIADAHPDNGQWFVDEEYNCMYKHTTENEKEYYRWLNRMYNEGILDPNWSTQTHEDYIAKISSGRVVAIMDAAWDYAEAETVLLADGKMEQTYAALPVTLSADQQCASLQYQGMGVGWGVGITKDCEDPVAAIKFLDYLCTDEGQVLINWGIEGTHYFYDEDGNRYRTEEEILASQTDPDYNKNTGIGYYVGNGWPRYSNGVLDATGQPVTRSTKESLIAEYNDIEKEAVAAWGVESLADIFPQASDFEIMPYSAIWAYQYPTELSDTIAILDEIAWPALINMVNGAPEDFDAAWDAMQEEFKDNGLEDANAGMTEFIAGKIAQNTASAE
ncbi:MAG: extracellular solute-binding protein [Lachnospiraceae bacterium]|nr:extracellular solute-binding protein [Lachnospiraceae bacterium]